MCRGYHFAVEGVASLAGIFFALGIVFFLAYTAIGLLALCCGTRKDGDKVHSKTGGWCRCIFGPRLWYLVAMLVLLGGTSAALRQVSLFRETVRFFVFTSPSVPHPCTAHYPSLPFCASLCVCMCR